MTFRARLLPALSLIPFLLVPRGAHAHPADLLFARLSFRQSEATLEITGDLANNPELAKADNMATALGGALRVALPGGRSWKISELGTPQISLSERFSTALPIPLPSSADAKPSEFCTARWTWRPSEAPIRFSVPEESNQTVLFWKTDSGPGQPAAPYWCMLLAGERTNALDLPEPPSPLKWNLKAGIAMGVAATGLLLQGVWILRRIRFHRRA